MFFCAGRDEVFSFATPIGVGSFEISSNLTKFLLSSKKIPQNLIFIGTAGSYGKIPLFEIINSKTASHIEQSFLNKHSYTPIDNIISTGKTLIINSSNYITTDSNNSKKFLELGIDLENMEFFAFMHVAQSFGIPAGGIFIVTNFTDQNAHSDYLKNKNIAINLLENWYQKRV